MVGLGFPEILILLVCAGLFFGSPIIVALLFFLAQRSRRSPEAAVGQHKSSPARQPQPAPPNEMSADSSILVARITHRFCPQCRSPLAADSPEGLCPACLMAGGLSSDVAIEPANGTAATTPPSGSKPPLAGEIGDLQQHFPQLEILELLGRGGMGAVYKARQKNLDRIVALKVIPPEAAKDPAFAERFNREARALARLNHPSIVTVYDFGQAGELHYLLMEYVDGVNLRQTLRAGRLAPREALAIVPPVCDALQYAHDQGVVHRDIKPENVLLDRTGRVKLADFGLAKLLGKGPDDYTLTHTQQVMGTPRYMAPEQIERPSSVDHRADIYSLGVVLYEMLTGELPMGRFEPPSHKVAVDVRIDEVVLRSLEKNPERRYQRASEVKTELASAASWPTLNAAAPLDTRMVGEGPGATGSNGNTARPSWHTPAHATKSDTPFATPGGVPLGQVLMVAFGMVLGVLMMGGGLAAIAYSFIYAFMDELSSPAVWSWTGAGFGCLVGGAGSTVGSYNTYRQMAGSQDLMRATHTTWFDWVMRGYLAFGVLLLAVGIVFMNPALPEVIGNTLLLIGGIATLQASLFVLWRLTVITGFSRSQAAPGAGENPFPVNASRERIRRQVRGAAIGLLVAGVLHLAPWVGFLLVWREILSEGGRRIPPEHSWAFAIPGLLALPAVIVMLLGGWKMRRLEGYSMAIIGSIAALLPCGPTWLISLPLGIWSLVTLLRADVKAEFEGAGGAQPPVAPPSVALNPVSERIRRRVAGPAIGLIIVGVLCLFPCAAMVLAVPALVVIPTSVQQQRVEESFERQPAMETAPDLPGGAVVLPADIAIRPPVLLAQREVMDQPMADMARGPIWAMLPVGVVMLLGLPLSLVMIVGGWRMMLLKSYGLAMVAAIVALLPCTFGWFLGLPIGIWALVTLLNDEVRGAFDREQHDLGPAATIPPKAPSIGPTSPPATLGRWASPVVVVVGGIVVLVCGAILVALLVPAIQSARAAAKRAHSMNNLRQIGIALHNYHDQFRTFPPAVVTDASGKPLYSGRVLLLPFLDQQNLYDAFDLTQPWDSPRNQPHSETALAIFMDPANQSENARSDYLFVTGAGTILEAGKKVSLEDVSSGDGAANTLLVVEVKGSGTSWAEPRELEISRPVSLPAGNHVGGNLLLFADGSARFVEKDLLGPSQVRALATRAGFEPLDVAPRDFEKLLRSLRTETFDSGKLSFIKSMSRTNHFNSKQVRQLLSEFDFDTDREEAAVVLHPRTIDPHDFYLALKAFADDSRRSAVIQRLALDNPAKSQNEEPGILVSKQEFDDLLAALKGAALDQGKLPLLKMIIHGRVFTSDQAAEMLKQFAFDGDREKAAIAVYPRLSDPENFYRTLEVFTFDTGRQSVRKQLKLE